MQFHPYEAFDNNKAQKKLWDSLKEAFKDDSGVAYYRYPIFTRAGNLRREPDILLVHRELGLWIIECKGCRIDNVKAIHGHEWQMSKWHSEIETPVAQAEDGMFAIRSKLEERRETRGLLSFHFRVALPCVKRDEWETKGWAELPSTQGIVLFSDDLIQGNQTPKALKRRLIEGAANHPQRKLSDVEWETVQAVLGGTLPAKLPREIPTDTALDNPVRVIQKLEARLKYLDEQQQKVAFEIPDGPQRIRGLAGTGKTVLFAKRIAKMHAAHPDWRIAFVFFTRALYDQILEVIALYYREMTGEEPDWSKVQVFHAWGAKEQSGFYRNLAQKSGQHPKGLDDVRREIGDVSPGQSFRYVCDCLEQDASKLPELFDAILIDEGQDLPHSFYRLAYKSLSEPKRLYWAYDEAQGIGSLTVPRPDEVFGLNVVDIQGRYKGGISKAHNLNRCYRTPRQLLMAAHAINMGLLRKGGPVQGVSNKDEWIKLGYTIVDGNFSTEGELVKITRESKESPHPIDSADFPLKTTLGSPLFIQTFSNETEEQKWIAEQIANDLALGFDPWDLMITGICGDNERLYYEALQAALQDRGVRSIIAGVDTSRDILRKDGHVTIASIFRAKGNEAWKVYACRFQYATQPLPWKQEQEIHKRNEAFVALTRARVWCIVTGIESSIFDELRTAKEQSPYLIFPAFNRASQSLKKINDE